MTDVISRKFEAFLVKYPLKKYKKGQVILETGRRVEAIYWAKSGYAWAYDLDDMDREIGIQIFRPLEFLSILSVKTGEENRHNIESLTPMEVWIIPKNDFEKFLKNNEDVAKMIDLAVAEKFLSLTDYMSQLVSGDDYKKVAGYLYNLVREFGVKRGGKINIKFKITHRLIASMTGLTRETVTLQMLKMEKNRLIDNEKRQVTILDRKRLKESLGY